MNELNIQKYESILNLLNTVGKIIENDSDYSEFYFKNQLARYFQSLMIIENCFKPATVLDVGSYPSHIHKMLLMMGYDVYGVDMDPNRISPGLNDCKNRTYKIDIERSGWNLGEKKYDIILFLEVMEHLHVNPFVVFDELENLIKKDGYLFLSTPNLLSMKNRINFVSGRYVFEHPFSVYEKLERHGSRGHQRLYSVNEIEDILDVYGYSITNKWCLNESSPLLNQHKISKNLNSDFDFERFLGFFSSSFSWRGKLKIKIENLMNNLFCSFYNTIFIVAKKKNAFDKDKVINKIKKSDPWVSIEKFQLK